MGTTFTLKMAAYGEGSMTSCDDFAVFQVQRTSLLLLFNVRQQEPSAWWLSTTVSCAC